MSTDEMQSRISWMRFAVSHAYPVYFTARVFSPNNPALRQAVSRQEPHRRHRLFFILEAEVVKSLPDLPQALKRYVHFHRRRMVMAGPPHVLRGGEAVKNDPSAPRRLQRLFQVFGMDRQSFVVVVGGGAVQDMAGYAAGTAHRGLRVVRVPTTVQSQCDSGVGVKTGINAFGKKNFLGTFSPPFAVLNDIQFITTLQPRDRLAGLAEAVKVALIRDGDFFDWLTRNAGRLAAGEIPALAVAIRRCAGLHMRHIVMSRNPFEFGSARPLDFGHWAAHKLESLTHYRLRHGEAVAIGMALDAVYSFLAGLLSAPSLESIIDLLKRLGFSLWDPALERRDARGQPRIFEGLDEFQQHMGGELTVTLLKKVGRGVEVHRIRRDLLRVSLDALRRCAAEP